MLIAYTSFQLYYSKLKMGNVETRVMFPDKVLHLPLPPKKVITFVTATCNATIGQYIKIHVADVAKFFYLIYCAPDKKVWETLL